MRISKYFTLSEATHSDTANRLGISNAPTTQDLVAIKDTAMRMDAVRELLGAPILVNSWYRNPAVNKAVGGVSNSDHMSGKSVDFRSPKFGNIRDICEQVVKSGIKFDQLIYEQGKHSEWVHLGFGERMRGEVLSWKSGIGYRQGIQKL